MSVSFSYWPRGGQGKDDVDSTYDSPNDSPNDSHDCPDQDKDDVDSPYDSPYDSPDCPDQDKENVDSPDCSDLIVPVLLQGQGHHHQQGDQVLRVQHEVLLPGEGVSHSYIAD